MSLRLAGATIGLGLLVAGCGPNGEPPLIVAAATSLTEVLTEIASIHRERGRRDVSFNFAGSSALARQILSGAPVDVFVSADARQMDRVERAGAVLGGTRRPIAGNALVVVVPGTGRQQWTNAHPLMSPAVRRIAIADVDAVPAGVYAKAWLERQEMWEQVTDKLVPTANVRAALAAVDTASADAAIVYRTDARVPGERSVVYEVPEAAAPPIVYYAAVIAQSRSAGAARAFVDLLASEEGRGVLTRHGFSDVR
jgi:molybdate transport system substrate-binding protein